MATLFMAGGSFARVFAGNNGISMRISGSTNLPAKFKRFKAKFTRESKDLLRLHGTALCHEMAMYSLPTRANTQLTANNAVQKYAQENQALASVAFKGWDSKDAMFWLLSPYTNVAQYVVTQQNFTFQSTVAQNLYNIGKFDLLRDFLIKKGFKPAGNIPTPEFVQQKAELGTFIQWKSQYKKGGKRGPYYVKDKASIIKIAQEGKVNNYASIVINGWLNASKDLGDVLPAGVKRINWPYGKGIGWGNGKVEKYGHAGGKLTISNQYYNLNGIFNTPYQRAIWGRRMSMIEADAKKFFDKMIAYWDKSP